MVLRRLWGMSSSSREEIVEVFDVVDAGLDRLCELTFDVLTTPERLRALEHLERMARQLRAPQQPLINQLDAQAGEEELGGKLRTALADRLRITKAEAGQRIAPRSSAHLHRPATFSRILPPRRRCCTASWICSRGYTPATGTTRAPSATSGAASRMTGTTLSR